MSQSYPVSARLTERLSDVIMMLEASDAYNREYIADVCRLILGDLAPYQQEPHERTYLRGWNEAVERCAEIAESSAVTSNGTKIGIGIATKIRTLADTSTVGNSK